MNKEKQVVRKYCFGNFLDLGFGLYASSPC